MGIETVIQVIIGIIAIFLTYLAIVPSYKKLDLHIRLNKLDIKIIVYIVLFAIFCLLFFEPLKKIFYFIDIYFIKGILIYLKKYGFNKNSFVLLMFISALAYISYRINKFLISKKNIKEFSDLFENLFYNKNYDDLTLLLEKHVNNIVKLNSSSLINKFASKLYRIYAQPWQNMVEIASFATETLDSKTATKQNCIKEIINKLCTAIANFLQHDEPHHDLIYNLFNRLLTSEEYAKYLAATKPYFCLDIISYNLNRDFLDIFIISIMRDKHSIYFYELNNYLENYNRKGKLLNYFFADIKVAEKLAVYRPVGEEVIYQLENNQQLITRYNQESKRYYNSEKNNCPIYISLQFFNLMITNAIHQGIQSHMWLYYFNHFIKKIIAQINIYEDLDYNSEWPTIFHYLIDEIVSILFTWLKQYRRAENKESLTYENNELYGNAQSIIKNAIIELSNVVFSIISTDKLSDRFKISTIETLIYFIRDNQNIDGYDKIISLIMKAIVSKAEYNFNYRIIFLKN